MRKSVVFLLGAIYLVSIVVVTFFGMQAKMDQFQIYMTSIEITSYDQIVRGNKYLNLTYNETEGYSSIFITYAYNPSNATFPEKVSFSLVGNTYEDEEGITQFYATISPMGELVFYKRKAVTVTITTTDGSKLSDSVMVICR